MINITIHRGSRQIGGSIIEIAIGNTNVLIDCGSELPGSQGSVRDEDIVTMLRKRNFDAILFTHYHNDHTGLMDKIPETIPIYMDQAMLEILQILHHYTKKTAMQKILDNSDGRIHTCTPGKTFTIGDMKIIPFFVDHSAYHANMFLLEGAGRTILHSGDFRSTGYLSKSLDAIPKIIRDRFHKQVDVLLCEGTMLTRSVEREQLLTEWNLQEKVKEFMKDHRQIFVVCSSTNFDSLASICKAAMANSLPVYANNHIIDMIKYFSQNVKMHTSFYNFPEVRCIKDFWKNQKNGYVLLLGSLLKREKSKIVKLYGNYGKGMREYNPWLIYSMWQGYLNPEHLGYDEGLAAFVKQFGSQVYYAHSTGHADKNSLAKFITEISPRKCIIPFHTESPTGFVDLPIEDNYKNMVIIPNDGETITIA